MFKTFITPIVASAVALTLVSAPAIAGSAGQDRQDRLGGSQQIWQQDGKKVRKAKRRAGQRKAARRGNFKQRRAARKARRNGGGAGGYAAANGHMLDGYVLPEWAHGHNQPLDNGSGSITQMLGGYDLPEWVGGHNGPMHDGSGSILDAIGGVDVYK